MHPLSRASGFTLIEMIMVIAITGIVGAMVAVFLRAPIDSYIAQDRRARLTDAADTALRRMGRDIRLALPNSVRVDTTATGVVYLEFLQTRDGGRYRAEGDGTPGNDNLDFTLADSSFEVLGPAIAMRTGDFIAVYNLGIDGAEAWRGETLTPYTGAAGLQTTIAFTPKQFLLASPGNRFQVVEGPVTYECNPGAGTVTRYWGYTASPTQPTPPPAAASRALIATGVVACNFIYRSGATERGGLVSMTLDLGQDGETVRLYSATQVSNQP